MGTKTQTEKFAGAVNSYSIEHILPDGYTIQGPDFHFDGQNFAKAFDIKYLDKEGNYQYVWQNTYAISTRELGVMVAMHSDNKGLVLPPKLAYIQIVIIPIFSKGNEQKLVDYVRQIKAKLDSKYRVIIDDSKEYSPGYKFSEYELRGVPLRIEVGSRELESKQATCTRRDTGERTTVGIENIETEVGKLLEAIHNELYRRADEFLRKNVHVVFDYDTFKKTLVEKKGIVQAPWCGSTECEAKIKEETSAKITNIPFDQSSLQKDLKCVYCGKPAKYMANFGRSY